MITGICIENFKGIRERVEIELRPITLLFGANSAGKSTILHALHYAQEIFGRQNLNPDRTLTGGPYIDLGGFRTFVHGHDLSRPIRISLKVDLRHRGDEFHWLGLDAVHEYLHFDRWSTGTLDCFGEFSSAEVRVEIRWSEFQEKPYASELRVTLDDDAFATFHSDPQGKRVTLQLNATHPSLSRLIDWSPGKDEEGSEDLEHVDDVFSDSSQTCLAASLKAFEQFCQRSDDGQYFLTGMADALPTMGRPIPFAFLDSDQWPAPDDFDERVSRHQFVDAMVKGLSPLVLIPLDEVQGFLSRLRYLGPLRETPPRNYEPPRFADPARWASGLGAWDTLQHGPDKFVEAVGSWLGDEDRLNSGYRVERHRYKELDLADPLIVQLLTGRAYDEADRQSRIDLDRLPTKSRLVVIPDGGELELRPHDVGIGISQVVPVVATALDGERRLLAIEQPELHLHPKLQAELGDLFIEAALGARQHLVILETHSELITLRVMRRIRESYDGLVEGGRPVVSSKHVAIYYIESYKGATTTTRLELGKEGQLLDPWPDGFFEEGFRERFAN